jgi:hypothetical protein
VADGHAEPGLGDLAHDGGEVVGGAAEALVGVHVLEDGASLRVRSTALGQLSRSSR